MFDNRGLMEKLWAMPETIEQRRARKRLARAANPEPHRQRRREWGNANKDRRKKYNRKWYLANKQYFIDRRKNPATRIAIYYRTRVWCAIKRFCDKASKSAPTARLIGCSIQELCQHLESQFRQGMTWENYGPIWHVDHIKPCAAFDLTKPEEQTACFHYTNLQPLFAEENLTKNKTYAH